MPPATSDDPNRQYSQSWEDEPTFNTDQSRPVQEHEPSGKSKKKNKKKAKAAAKALTETPPDHLLQASPVAPVEPSSCPDPTLNNDVNPVVASPVLDALDTIDGAAETDVVTRTDTWAQSVPYGKSPPIDLMDGEMPHESPINFPAIQARGGFSQPSSASPPTRIRPFSYGSGYRSSMQSRQPSVDRRKSQSFGSPLSNLVPPPHLPQAHFYGAPDIDLGAQPRPSSDAAYSFCGFDTLPSFSAKSPRAGITVLVVGSDGAVEILAVEDRRTRLVGQITGLGGRVLEAKILSGQSYNDSLAASQPHIAVTIHGPIPPSDEEAPASSAGSDVHEAPPSMARGRSGDRRSEPSLYQTRVQVYSLRSGTHIAMLFASKAMPALENIPGQPSFAPLPIGSLRLFTSGNHLVVASGISGEVYVFRYTSPDIYQCLGKTWTNVQTGEIRRYSTSSSSTDPDGSHSDAPRTFPTERPILALQGRWLTIVPPSTSYRGSIQGVVPPGLMHDKAQGLETRSPPSVPSVNCATDVGEGESFLNKMARGVTQELVKGARWMGDQGLQAWNNYWNSPQAPGTPPPSRPNRLPENMAQGYGVFPPTHAQDTQATSSPEPDTVSIIDLKRFDDGVDTKSASLYPLATFQVPNGCSFLSLSPNGLMLFTGSKKGDVQYVWDLMQLKHCRAMAFIADDHSSHSPNVRQVARYARLTTSSIMDVIWTPPVGDRLAVITRKGTVHVFDLPQSAFQWPPFRRARSAGKRSSSVEPASDDVSFQPNTGNPLSAAMKLVGGRTQPFFSAVRDRVPSSGAGFSGMSGFALPTAASIKGGKVVAAGLSKSMGAAATGTVHTLRHVGENRLHLTGLARDPASSRVMWVLNKGSVLLGVVDDGNFKLYRLKKGPTNQKNRQFHSVIGGKESQFKLPANLQNTCGPAALVAYDPGVVVHASLLLPSVSSQPTSAAKPFCQPLSQAEIETNTPYQPFHTDQRVSLHVFSTETGASVPSGQWVFGNDMPTTKVHVRSYSNSGDSNGDDDDENAAVHGHSLGAGGDMENLITLGNSTGNVEEVVITTRRKKKHSTPLKADDGFFEDDCEVLDFARDRV
ncbi:hypothetical protein N7509_003577 [Penicillium cosmopolitanum]|uniref:Uncharacterized protein n=1 Tax=Penicillium cosmopolitanum TaxID=1131564 RepID=A0A9X0BBH4_9EURO|nr:uncharacterized protein N7509_003577 [Penicillium cosmopolitanum]KAJ5403706.1 hypothetical protein N7509_003577 [Penicillium cosmopolitanum]